MAKLGYSRLPETEEAICLRLREVRQNLKWKQRDFAGELGITRERLASYEYARAPVRYSLAKKLGETFDVNQRWLATGKLPKEGYLSVAEPAEAALPAEALFSFAYQNLLSEWVEEAHKAAAEIQGVPEKDIDPMVLDAFQPLGDPKIGVRKALLQQLKFIYGLQAIIPDSLFDEYVKALRGVAGDFIEHHGEQLNSYLKGRSDEEKQNVHFIKTMAKLKIAQRNSRKRKR
jgi:transcriptional regulator with XRE-family HTH domain